MNEDVVEQTEVVVENMADGTVVENVVEQTSAVANEAVDTSVEIADAMESVTESANSFITWIKGFFTWEALFKLIGILIVVLIVFAIYKVALNGVRKIPKEKLTDHKKKLIERVLRYIYYFIAITVVLRFFGIKLSAIWGAAGVAGVGVAFAAQTSLSNIISGTFIVFEKMMKIGDLITVGSETGVVDSIGLLSVQIKTYDNQLIRIPNSTIISSNMINTTYYPKRRMTITVSISYDTDMEYAMETLKKVPSLCSAVLEDPAPLVWFDAFDSSGINIVLAIWFKNSDALQAKNEAFIAIKKVFDEANIEIPYTKVDVNFFEGEKNKSTLVKTLPAKKLQEVNVAKSKTTSKPKEITAKTKNANAKSAIKKA